MTFEDLKVINFQIIQVKSKGRAALLTNVRKMRKHDATVHYYDIATWHHLHKITIGDIVITIWTHYINNSHHHQVSE